MPSPKIVPFEKILTLVERWHEDHQTLVLVTGVFDLLHRAHQEFLAKARAVGDFLVVGLESDERVRALKGPNRPVEPLAIRLAHVAQLPDVDAVFGLPPTFDNLDAYESLIRDLTPQILAVSSHSPFLKVKQKLLAKYGGEVRIVMEQDSSISTTKILVHKNMRT